MIKRLQTISPYSFHFFLNKIKPETIDSKLENLLSLPFPQTPPSWCAQKIVNLTVEALWLFRMPMKYR